MESIDIFIKDMQMQNNIIRNRMIIDDIFDIAKGYFKTYDVYVQFKQKRIDSVRNANERQISTEDGKYIFTYYIEPLILSEQDFNYIVDKYREV